MTDTGLILLFTCVRSVFDLITLCGLGTDAGVALYILILRHIPGIRCQVPLPPFKLQAAAEPPAMPLVKTMYLELSADNKMSLEPVVASCCYLRPPVSKYASEHPGVTASDSTRYRSIWSTMVHWLLCSGPLVLL